MAKPITAKGYNSRGYIPERNIEPPMTTVAPFGWLSRNYLGNPPSNPPIMAPNKGAFKHASYKV